MKFCLSAYKVWRFRLRIQMCLFHLILPAALIFFLPPLLLDLPPIPLEERVRTSSALLGRYTIVFTSGAAARSKNPRKLLSLPRVNLL